MAAFDTFEIKLKGRGTHAAMPHLGTDVIIAAAQVTNALQCITSRRLDPQHACALSITQVHAGDTWNVLPQEAVLRGCLRYFTAAETDIAAEAARQVVGVADVDCHAVPSMASEDFGFMLQQRPGCYIWLGNGPGDGGCTLHNPRYDFNDRIIKTGVAYWVQLARRCLGAKLMRGDPPNQSLPIETRITALRDNPTALGTVADWVHRQWGAFSGRTQAQTHARFAEELEPDAPVLPFTLVAVLEQLPAGVLTLRERDSTDFDPGTCPWITNVFVPETSRGCGIARALCIHAESVARDQGFTTLFLASEHGSESLYADLGYRVYKVFRDRRATQHLMRKSIIW